MATVSDGGLVVTMVMFGMIKSTSNTNVITYRNYINQQKLVEVVASMAIDMKVNLRASIDASSVATCVHAHVNRCRC